MHFKEIAATAEKAGFSGVAFMLAKDVVLSREFRDACAANRCGLYGKCYMCPPDCGDIDTLMARVHSFSDALLLQTVSPLEDSYDFEGMVAAGKKHADLTRELWEKLRTVLPSDSLCLSKGGCGFCKQCAKVTGEPCRFPENALSSLEAYGVSVSETVAKTALKYINGQNTVTYFSLILFND